ncbi:MAG: peptide chain release factor N(5)-glutamine methyltransferase [Shimia sp.]
MKTRDALALAGGDVTPRDARLLLSEVVGRPLPDEISQGQAGRYRTMLKRRLKGEPVSHILGRRAFWRHEFKVTPDVLDPRPETEVLVAEALQGPFASVLDLGVGSGCILLSLLAERPEAIGVGVDISAGALEVAGKNARRLGVEDRTTLRQGSWFDGLTSRFDLVTSNPPYIAAAEMAGLAPDLRFEPRAALTDEGDGLSAYRAILSRAAQHLAPGGRLLLELGAAQGAAVTAIARDHGWQSRLVLDLDGRNRVLIAMPGENAPQTAENR